MTATPLTAVEGAGYHVDSGYVDLFWTPIIGPSSMLLWRRLVVEAPPQGVGTVDLPGLAAECGIVKRQRGLHALDRLVSYRVCAWRSDGTLEVHRRIGPLREGLLSRLTPRLRELHPFAAAGQLPDHVDPGLAAVLEAIRAG